jgi:hypothetical protein
MITVVTETGTGDPAANSYVTVAEVDAIHSISLYADEWNQSTDDDKAKAIISATRLIDADCRFRGYRRTEAQALEWPRYKAKNDDAYGQRPGQISALYMSYYDDSKIPERLKQGVAQVALDLLRGDRTQDVSSKGIRSLGIGQGAVTLSIDSGTVQTPLSDAAKRILAKLGSFRYGYGPRKLRRTS